jgi:hypothetical protein
VIGGYRLSVHGCDWQATGNNLPEWKQELVIGEYRLSVAVAGRLLDSMYQKENRSLIECGCDWQATGNNVPEGKQKLLIGGNRLSLAVIGRLLNWSYVSHGAVEVCGLGIGLTDRLLWWTKTLKRAISKSCKHFRPWLKEKVPSNPNFVRGSITSLPQQRIFLLKCQVYSIRYIIFLETKLILKS